MSDLKITVNFRAHGSGNARTLRSHMGYKTATVAYTSMVDLDHAYSSPTFDHAKWQLVNLTVEDDPIELRAKDFPETVVERIVARTLSPLDAVLVMRELQERWRAYLTAVDELLAELDGDAMAYDFLQNRPLAKLSKAHSGDFNWSA